MERRKLSVKESSVIVCWCDFGDYKWHRDILEISEAKTFIKEKICKSIIAVWDCLLKVYVPISDFLEY